MGPEDVEPTTAIDLMRKHYILKQPRIDQEKYDMDALEFTDEFNRAMNDTLIRLASDPANKFLNINEGLKSIIHNFLGKNVNLSKDELAKINMMVFSLKTVQDEIE